MALILKPARWGRQQPQRFVGVDWLHPLARDLAICGVGFGRFFVNRLGGVVTIGNQIFRSGSPLGEALLCDTFVSNGHLRVTTPNLTPSTPFTLWAFGRRDSQDGGERYVASLGNSGANSPYVRIGTFNNSTWRVTVVDDTSVVSQQDVSHPSSSFSMIALVYEGTGAAPKSGYLNGKLFSSSTASLGATTLNQFAWGCLYRTTPIQNWSGPTPIVGLHTRALSAAEIAWLYERPFDFFEPDLARSFHFFTAGGVTHTIDVNSAEFDWEARSVLLTPYKLASDSAEFDWEALSASLTRNLVVVNAEFDWEVNSVALGASIITNGAEFDWEAQSAALVRNLIVNSSEYDREIQSAAISTGIVINSAEFEREFSSAGLVRNIVAQSSEYDFEIQSVAFLVTGIDVASTEFDREFSSTGLVRNLVPQTSEYDFEIKSVSLPATGTQDVDSAEFDWEAESVFLRQFMVPANTWRGRVHCVFQKNRRINISCC